MKGPPLGPGEEDITCPDQVAPRGQKASSTRKIKPQTSNLCRGTKSEMIHMWAQWLPNPCRLGGPQCSARGQNQKWPTCGHSSYLTPVPNALHGDKIRNGAHVAALAT